MSCISQPFSLNIEKLSNSLQIPGPSLLFRHLDVALVRVLRAASSPTSLELPGNHELIFPDLGRKSALPGSPPWPFLAPTADPTQDELEDLTGLLRNLSA